MPAEVCADRGRVACWRGVGTRMHRCAGAHLGSGSELGATTNRRKCMWIIPQPRIEGMTLHISKVNTQLSPSSTRIVDRQRLREIGAGAANKLIMAATPWGPAMKSWHLTSGTTKIM